MEDKKESLQANDGSAQHPEQHEFQDLSPGGEKFNDTAPLPIDEAMNTLLNRKFDRHILPWLFGMWLLAFIDRANIGNAKIDGLVEDLRLDGNKFNISLAIFYVPYICVDVPSNLVLKYFKAGQYLPALLVGWGLTATFMGFVGSFEGLLAARFFLGLFEGGLLGGMILYLSMFYPRHAMLWRIGLFYSAAPLSGAFGGLLATGLARIKTEGYNGWPFIFFVEGAITVVFGLIAVCFLPNTPSDSKFLSPEQQEAANQRMKSDSQSSTSNANVEKEKFDWHWVKLAIFDVNTILLSIIFFFIITPIYSFSLFLPTINSTFGYSRVVAQLLTVPPNIAGFLSVLLISWLSDHYKRRGIFMLIGCSLTLIGYIMLISTPRSLVQYGGTFFVAAGIFPCSPLVMGWLSNNLAPHYVRATGTGFQIMLANCAAFIATFTYIRDDAPRYTTGHAINLGTVVGAIVTVCILLVYNTAENRRRETGKRDYRLREGESEDRLGSRHPNFRYTL
ncbi:related to putative tartrate transporter [Ramularia collo-cygni]|uniref:Related to putative tartrate transporter n=1 Tax=Ramularia collo-cygni TaxID=112498 RepID=A0A2D3UML5_9PEZI|nr:related to putative tartrate transporter [Ramularia collo-cygni]CZT15451.1 related to putative tartrate transporter [Ramularia collo-cygni]